MKKKVEQDKLTVKKKQKDSELQQTLLGVSARHWCSQDTLQQIRNILRCAILSLSRICKLSCAIRAPGRFAWYRVTVRN